MTLDDRVAYLRNEYNEYVNSIGIRESEALHKAYEIHRLFQSWVMRKLAQQEEKLASYEDAFEELRKLHCM